ncbi:hypothetical protein [Ferroplasma acidarmanus]|uniref:Uncharacterized protein n=1 Tax=Ferroplasma acidarmanus Fer1 TaxID=333146 RepID=S0ATH9_FERAC|nr:hypothetical protein [Ferroplasma acidarmanus]AGO61415.1 hypothetical protein FACI_IFERC00001G1435 [Ferroplasma acidarmanus Fer1]
MDENEYITKKEIIKELLYKDRNFFSSINPEFSIFKYTSFFAVVTFTFQFIIVMINSFTGFGYLTYFQSPASGLSVIFIFSLIGLYIGLTRAIRKSYHNRKGVYLRLYKCRNCDFTSFSEFYSNLHIVSHPNHILNDNQILIKYDKNSFIPWFFGLLAISKRKKLKKNYDRDFIILTDSSQRIRYEIKGNKWYWASLIVLILFIAITPVYLYYTYYIYRSLELLIIQLIVFFTAFIICAYVTIALKTEDVNNVYIFMLKLEYQEEQWNPYTKLKYVKLPYGYWAWVEKKSEMEPIEVQDGKLYIVNKIVLNKFKEVIGVIPEKSSNK